MTWFRVQRVLAGLKTCTHTRKLACILEKMHLRGRGLWERYLCLRVGYMLYFWRSARFGRLYELWWGYVLFTSSGQVLEKFNINMEANYMIVPILLFVFILIGVARVSLSFYCIMIDPRYRLISLSIFFCCCCWMFKNFYVTKEELMEISTKLFSNVQGVSLTTNSVFTYFRKIWIMINSMWNRSKIIFNQCFYCYS